MQYNRVYVGVVRGKGKKRENAVCREEAVGRGAGVSWVVLLGSEAEEEKRER